MRRLLVTILAAAPLFVLAAPPSNAQLERLLVDMQAQRQLEAVQQAIGPMMRRSIDQLTQKREMDAEQRAKFDRFMDKSLAVMREQLAWDQMKPQMLQIYGESFEADEVEGLIAFYESPAGRAFVAKMPVVMQKSMALSQARMQSMMQAMEKAMREAMEEQGSGK
jgi:hypothetical protein